MVDPRWLMCTSNDFALARSQLQRFSEGQRDDITDAQLWRARTMLAATHHPESGEKLNPVFTMAAFVPANVPICAGMILTAPTVFNTVLWQAVNQSLNAGFNYSNRSGSDSGARDLAIGYASAVAVSCGVAVGLGQMVKRAVGLSPGTRAVVQGTVPFIAVASAGVANMLLMRRKEAFDGVKVFTKDGVEVGTSAAAGRQALALTAITRVLVPVPALLLPSLIMLRLSRLPAFQNNRVLKTTAEISVITACIWGALPPAIALFPPKYGISPKELEPEFHSRPETLLYFNKGI